jgi:glyoxylase-like metal-dependent hydrolase (beta-lactamase superfamily II)
MKYVPKSIWAPTLGFVLATICWAKTASGLPTPPGHGGFPNASTDTPSRPQTVEAAKGVYLFSSPDFDGIEVNGNSIAVVCDHDVLVFDTNVLPSSAALVLNEIREISNKPVRYVVNSHWHPDHWDGNEVYAKRFPDLEIISSTDTRRLMENSMHIYGKTIEKLSADPAKQMQASLQTGKNPDGSAISDSDRKEFLKDLQIQKEFMAEYNAMHPVLPTLTFDRQLTLYHGGREIRLMQFVGNTAGDTVLYLPQEKTLIAGDLLTLPIPFGADSHPSQWIRSLKMLSSLDIDVIIPGHGPVQHDKAYLDLLIAALQSVVDQVHDALGRGLTLEQTRQVVKIDDIRKKFTRGDATLDAEFEGNFTQPIVRQVYDEATEELELYQ